METNDIFRIIVIDDNPLIHHDFIKILANTAEADTKLDELSTKIFGKIAHDSILPVFQIDTASQGEEGLNCIKRGFENNCPYSLAFVDIRMPPGWDGIETIKHIWSVDPEIQIVICTAYSDYSWEETVSNLGKKDNLLILKKPFDTVSVRQLACALTKKWQLLQDSKQFTSSLKQQIDDKTISLQKSLSLVKATLESPDEGIIVINENGEIVDYNQKFFTMWAVPQTIIESKNKTLLGEHIANSIQNPEAFTALFNSFDNILEHIHIDAITLKDGRIFDCHSQPQMLDTKIIGRVFNFRDISERTILERELQYQATHDPLTDLPNRVLLLERIREAISTSSQTNTQFALLFLDLDRFKLINDSLGHAAGDELLLAAAKRIGALMREEDTLARLGGDEFVIILNNIASDEEVIRKVNSIIQAFHQPFKVQDREVTVTSSIGISIFPRDGKVADTLLRNADICMYHAKERGSNTYQFYTEKMNEKSLENLDIEMQLHEALQNDNLFLCYQPQFDLNTRKLCAVEALIRWDHPKKGLILPIDFIPLAEETGLIVPIGEWVLRTACKQNKAWQEAGLKPIRVAVNISAQQLKQANIVDVVKSVLEETKLEPQYLELELTENIIISSPEVIRNAKRLKELGVAIAVDDFGTGYSSLSYLKKLPLDRLKIDGSFIQNIQYDMDDAIIMRAIIAVAKNLDLDVLAEGVETEDQIEFLKEQKCNEVQGYYFSQPLSVEELTDMMSKIADEREKVKE